MNENKKLGFKNLIFSALGQVITIAIGLILPRLYITSFGSEINGLLNSVNQYVIYLSLFEAGVGVVTLQALYKPVVERDKNSINSILAATHYYYKKTSLFYLLGLLILSVIYPFLAKSEVDYWIIFCCVFLSGIGNVIVFAVQGKYKLLLEVEGKNYIFTNLTTIITVLTGVVKVVLIMWGCNIVIVLFATFLIHSIQTVYILVYIKKKYKWLNLKVEPNKNAISQKNYTLLHQIAGLIFQNTDVLILTIVCGLKVVSVYSMYKLIITHLESILNIISNSFSFILGKTFQVDRAQYKERIDFFESTYSGTAFALFSVALFLFLPFMELYTSGVQDINYIDYKLAILFVSIALLAVARTPMLKTINYAGHFKLTTPQTIIETVINVVVSIVGVYFFGIYGVLLGTVCALIYRTNDIIIYSNIKLLNRSPLKTYLIYIINIVVLILLQVIFNILFNNWRIVSYIDLIGIGFISVIIALILCLGSQYILFSANRKIIKEFLVNK